MHKDSQQFHNPWDRDCYETGSTRPPKQHGGIIAFLLVLVILLGGLCSALGILNFRLLQELAQGDQKHQTLEVFEGSMALDPKETMAVPGSPMPRLGITGQTVSDFDRRYYELPQGVLVTDVTQAHSSWKAGLRVGDVICGLDGRAMDTQEDLTDALNRLRAGQQVHIEIFRSQTRERFTARVTIEE